MRVIGVPTVADRIAQTVVRAHLEPEVEPLFHPDSYGYRPGRSALDAVGVCRQRCWQNNWVIDLDIRAFFDSIPHSLLLKAVSKHTDLPWVLLYVKRWLEAPLQREDCTIVERDRGTRPSPSGEEVAIGHRQEVFEDVGPVVDEVSDSQLLADRVLVLASTDEVHVARWDFVVAQEAVRPEPLAGQVRDLRSRLGNDIDPVVERGAEDTDCLARARTAGVSIGRAPKKELSEVSATRSVRTPPTSRPRIAGTVPA